MIKKALGMIAALAISASFTANADIAKAMPEGMDALNSLPTRLLSRSEASLAPAKADEKPATLTFDFGYCYEPRSVNSFTEGDKQKAAIYFPAESCERYAGATLEAVVIANGCIPNEDFADFKISFYRTVDEGAEPFYSFDAKMEVRNYMAWKTYELPEPFVIEAGKPFYFVTEWPVKYWPKDTDDPNNNFYPFATDETIVPDDRGYSDMQYCINTSTKEYGWTNFGILLGNNCMRLRLTGDHLPVDDVSLSKLTAPLRVSPGNEFYCSAVITNWGANEVTDCTISVKVGNGTPVEHNFVFTDKMNNPSPLAFHESFYVEFPAVTDEMRPNLPIEVKVVSVNSRPDGDNSGDVVTSATLSISDEDGYRRGLFIEESTGTWCGWCPMGIVSFEEMRDLAPNQFCGVAIHNGTDPMTPWDGSFDSTIRLFNGQAPLMFVNGDSNVPLSPTSQNMIVGYNLYCSDPSYVDINIDMKSASADEVEIETTYEFAGPADNVYSLVYIITEDKVGPYPQKNYYPTGVMGEMAGWENKPDVVNVVYNDVAVTRVTDDNTKVFPTEIAGKTPYVDKRTIKIDNSKRPAARKAVKPEDVNVVVAVINNLSGMIENCGIRRADSFTSIESVAAPVDTDAPVEYFDLNGRRVANPSTHGIYLMRQGAKASKVIL